MSKMRKIITILRIFLVQTTGLVAGEKKLLYNEKNYRLNKVDTSCCAGVTPDSHEEVFVTMKMCQIDIK